MSEVINCTVFNGQLSQEYLHQKLLKSYFLFKLRSKMLGMFLRQSVYHTCVPRQNTPSVTAMI